MKIDKSIFMAALCAAFIPVVIVYGLSKAAQTPKPETKQAPKQESDFVKWMKRKQDDYVTNYVYIVNQQPLVKEIVYVTQYVERPNPSTTYMIPHTNPKPIRFPYVEYGIPHSNILLSPTEFETGPGLLITNGIIIP